MHAITYESPKSLAQALSLLAAAGEKGRVLAGGTDLLIQMRAGVRKPDQLIDAKNIAELQVLSFSPQDGLRLGAAVSCCRLIEDPAVQQHYPGLVEAAGLIGSVQIQSRCSLGGNLCNGSPAADTTPALIALGAVCHVAGAKGARTVAVEDFVVSPGRTVLQPDELLVEFRIPAPKPHSSDCYQRFIPRNEMDIAVVGVGAAVTLNGNTCTAARIALGAVAPTPLFAKEASASLVGKPLNENTIAAAAALAQQVAIPITDMRGTEEYRKHLVGVLTRRVLGVAAERARK
ncbi:MAG TPA: xanthine dehydrogenase family protein subunit M [Candidatus Binatia bacterium]|nr:xanthine dehydrogenase family protein subunit M [Candidatus Binatia bacterium]